MIPEEGEIPYRDAYNYILEMICDWWAFSWAKGNLNDIFLGMKNVKTILKLHPNSRKILDILGSNKKLS